jgi:predicted ATPase
LRSAATPLVGRSEEIELLLRRWDQVKRGDGGVVLISGEPGIGKSRIAQSVAERISAEPHTRLRYFCSPHHQDSALYPSIAQLERAAGFRREDAADQRLDRLEAVLALGSNDLTEAIPLLADLLSIPTGHRYPPLNLTPQKRKEKTLYAQLVQVEGLAARDPMLMVSRHLYSALFVGKIAEVGELTHGASTYPCRCPSASLTVTDKREPARTCLRARSS